MSSKVVLEVWGLRKVYGDVVAVDSVSFKVFSNSFVTLLGPNGAGKSTLINMIVGVTPPSEGKVYVLGKDIWKFKEVKKKIGFVPQELGLVNELNVYENLILNAINYGVNYDEAKLRAKEVIELMDLKGYEKKLIPKLSGGLKRRVAIGMALMHNPEILILDEPTTGLDPSARLKLIKILRKLMKENNKAILMSTHITDDAEHSDRVLIMHKGKIIEDGNPQELKNKIIKHSNIIELTVNNLKKATQVLESNFEIINVLKEKNIIRLSVRNLEKELPKLLSMLIKGNVEVNETHVRKPTLNDVFIILTGKSLEEWG